MNSKKPPKPVNEDQQLASYIAMVVRNAMEDFHCEHLTDDQMKELNPIIRNAVCTALHAFNNYEHTDAAARFVDYNFRMIPKYWEKLCWPSDFCAVALSAQLAVWLALTVFNDGCVSDEPFAAARTSEPLY